MFKLWCITYKGNLKPPLTVLKFDKGTLYHSGGSIYQCKTDAEKALQSLINSYNLKKEWRPDDDKMNLDDFKIIEMIENKNI